MSLDMDTEREGSTEAVPEQGMQVNGVELRRAVGILQSSLEPRDWDKFVIGFPNEEACRKFHEVIKAHEQGRLVKGSEGEAVDDQADGFR